MDVLAFAGQIEKAIGKVISKSRAVGKDALRRTARQRDDLRGECYAALLAADKRLSAARNPAAYASRIVRNRIVSVLARGVPRQKGSRKQPGDEIRVESLSNRRIFDAAEHAAEHDPTGGYTIGISLSEALGRLPPDEGEILRLFFGLGREKLTLEQIAIFTGKTIKQVRTVKRRAIAGMRGMLKAKTNAG